MHVRRAPPRRRGDQRIGPVHRGPRAKARRNEKQPAVRTAGCFVLRGARRRQRAVRMDQAAASLSFLRARTLIFTVAGLAANHCSSLVKGLMPLRFGLAGTLTTLIFSRPGRVNAPAPFLLTEACTAPSSDESTARTSLAATPVDSDRWATSPDLPMTSLIGLGAAGLAAAFFGAAFFFAIFTYPPDGVCVC